jgi:hypothetical protein
VQRDAHPQLGARRPFLGAKAGLNLAGCLQCAGGVLEGDAEGVADGLEDAAAVALDRRGEQDVVALQGNTHGLRLALPQAGRAFDVGKQEGGGDQRCIAQTQFCQSHSQSRALVTGES